MSESGRMTVLAIGAHPSDPIACVGGTLAKHVQRGDRVVALGLTYGVQHLSDKLIGRDVADIKEIVRGLTTEASGMLGIDECQFLDFGDTPLVSSRERLLELARAIRQARPDIIVLAHNPQQTGDHGEAARMVELAPCWISHGVEATLPPLSVRRTYRCALELLYPLHQPVLSVPDTYVDVTDTLELKIKAYTEVFMRYSSADVQKVTTNLRAVHRYFGVTAGVECAEAFTSSPRTAATPYLEG